MEVKYVCSLGTLCHTAFILKELYLKKASYPFDWVYTSPTLVKACLDDDFKLFLDKSEYISLNSTSCAHKTYGRLFNHRNPLENEADYAYTVRCVERFRTVLQSPEPKLFIIGAYNSEHDCYSPAYREAINALNESLSKVTTNYRLLSITHTATDHHSYTLTHDGNIDHLDIHLVTRSDGITFGDMRDNLYVKWLIKRNYQFNLINIY